MKKVKISLIIICISFATENMVAKDGEADQNRRIEYHQDDFDDNYAKDNFNVYYNGLVIKDASSSSFKVLEDGYAQDQWATYYRGKKISNESTLECLGKGYARSIFSVYYKGVKIPDATVLSFKVL